MEAKHTPGPWSLHRLTDLTVVGPDGDRTVATAGGYSNNRDQDRVDAENLANARLIAAAPDLLRIAHGNLATMEESVRRLERQGWSHAELDAAIDETRAIIAKVEAAP